MTPAEIKRINDSIGEDAKKTMKERGLPARILWCVTHKVCLVEDKWYAHAVSHGCPSFEIYEYTGHNIGACPD